MDYRGVIIEESLRDKSVLAHMQIESTEVEPVTEDHKTPWLQQWTLHTVKVSGSTAEQVANLISTSLADNYWYADFKNDKTHFIVFPNKIFKIDRSKAEEYQAATEYGKQLGIPEYQLDFAPNVVQWERPEKQ